MSLTVAIEIAAPPAVVRAKFLDFEKISTYTQAFVSISTEKPGVELQNGDKVSVKLAGSPAFPGTILTNTPEHLSWIGTLPYVFTGTHSFYIKPSESTPGGTTFTQQESFSGALGYLLMGDNLIGRGVGMKEKTRKTWTTFNEDLKKAVESEVAGGK